MNQCSWARLSSHTNYYLRMRLTILLSLLATPAFAWEFSSSPVCTLSHSTEEADLKVTFNSRTDGPYAIEVTQEQDWQPAPMFMMGFDGPRRSAITTDRHQLSGKTLTVTDSGFGNVLDGIEFNFVAIARSGETALVFSLTGAAEPVQRFRLCAASPEI